MPDLKQCSNRENCINPLGCWLPATNEHFHKMAQAKDGLKSTCKMCRKRETKKYYDENRDILVEKSKRYAAEHPDIIKRRSAEYYAKNKEMLLPKFVAWFKSHPEQKKRISNASYHRRKNDPSQVARRREYERKTSRRHGQLASIRRKLNPTKARARDRRYYQNNKPYFLAKAHKRRTMEGSFDKDDIQKQYGEQDGRCAYCGITLHDDYHVDHVHPIALGGSNWPNNLVVACAFCNLSKGDKTIVDWSAIRGW